MDSPFFPSYWNQPSHHHRYSPSVVSGIPVNRRHATAASSPKVVSIPVHFVETETETTLPKPGKTRPESALKIQKVFRGFLVRKSVKKIASIGKEVEEVETRVSKRETVELIRRDPKERLRINETLMASLFKLDSVRGIDSGVRDFRKAVIKRAIALQEKVDDLVANNDDSDMAPEEEIADQTQEITVSPVASKMDFDGNAANQMAESQDELVDHHHVTRDSTDDLSIESPFECNNWSDHPDKLGEAEEVENVESEPPALMEGNEFGVDSSEVMEDDEVPHCVVKEIVENCIVNPSEVCECSEEEVVETSSPSTEKHGNGGMEVQKDDKQQHMEEEEEEEEKCQGGNKKGLMERVMEDNEKMMRMMSELMERNEQQTRMLTCLLTQRVGQLEKAFLCDKLRRNKKKRQAQQH